MLESNLYKIFISRFNKAEIKYMVSGSVASIVYGEPRMTHDIDLILEIDETEIEKFKAVFSPDEFYLPPEDVIKIEIKRSSRGHFNIIHFNSGFKAVIYFCGNSEINRWGLENIQPQKIEEEILPLAPVEYVIVMKLEYYREGASQKHINDIQNILKYSKEIINFEVLNQFIEKYNLNNIWNKIKTL